MTYFTAPICDLFITVFELKERSNWLRRQAILIVLQQVLGGTIERCAHFQLRALWSTGRGTDLALVAKLSSKFRDGVKMLLSPPQLVGYISTLQNAMWPGGELKPKEPPRTASQKAETKESARRKLSALMPGAAHLPRLSRSFPAPLTQV